MIFGPKNKNPPVPCPGRDSKGVLRDADGYVLKDNEPVRAELTSSLLGGFKEGLSQASVDAQQAALEKVAYMKGLHQESAKAALELQTTLREFATGATRSPDAKRVDPEGFFSPLVFARFNAYMNFHRIQLDGTARPSDNWQKGLPLDTYMKGLWRHFLHFWTRHRGWAVKDPGAAPDIEGDLCAILFNAQGYLHELLKAKELDDGDEDGK